MREAPPIRRGFCYALRIPSAEGVRRALIFVQFLENLPIALFEKGKISLQLNNDISLFFAAQAAKGVFI